MEIIVVRKEEGLTCSVCFHTIKQNEEAFKFFNNGIPLERPLKIGHINIGNGKRVHYRHLLCQYNTNYPRSLPFEDWIKKTKFEIELHKNKVKFKQGLIGDKELRENKRLVYLEGV